MELRPLPPVGLDIGTSAVRVAEVTSGRGGAHLTGFGQVPLPPGAVVDGEIRDAGAVSDAISQLWKRAKVRSKKAIIGVANQRVVVRQVDLPFLEEKDFRSSLKFQVADHIPMSVEDAELDFEVLETYETDNGDKMMRVLLIAAATDMVESFVSAAASGGVDIVGVDLTPFAVARAVSPAARGETGVQGAQAVVDIGAGVTGIVIHVGGEARFVRILLVGGDDVTSHLAEDVGVSYEQAEALKLDLGRGVGSPDARRSLVGRVDELVNEIRGSLDYYLSQEDAVEVNSVILTGGGSLTAGLGERLQQVVRGGVEPARPLAGLDFGKSGLTAEQANQIEPVIAAGVGLALGSSKR